MLVATIRQPSLSGVEDQMQDTLKVGTWGAVNEGCPMSYKVTDGDAVDFTCEFVRLGAAALRRMEELADEQPGCGRPDVIAG
jgi:hypothetical protein